MLYFDWVNKIKFKLNYNKVINYIPKAICLSVLGFLITFYISLILTPWDYKPSRESLSSLHQKNLMGAINRAQQSYHFETKSFTENLPLLFGDQNFIENYCSYDYKCLIEVKDNIAFTYSITNKKYDIKKFFGVKLGKDEEKPFYSYVGVVVSYIQETEHHVEETQNIRYKAIVCKNDSIGKIKPNKPILQDNILLCGKGSSKGTYF